MNRQSETIPGASRTLLRDQAYIALVRAIVVGDLAPGDALNDGDLASQLGLSRTPVREALARLVDDGLVVTKPNAFTRVAPLSAAAARDAAVLTQTLQELAAHLASSAGRFTAEHATQARHATLEAMRLVARLEGMITDPVYEGKSMAGLVGMVADGTIAHGSRVLYAHLGGQLANGAYAAVVR